MKCIQENIEFDRFDFARYTYSGLIEMNTRDPIKFIFSYYTVLLIVDGEFRINHNGNRYLVKTGDLVYFPKFSFFTAYDFHKDKIKFYQFRFPGYRISPTIPKSYYDDLLLYRYDFLKQNNVINLFEQIYTTSICRDEKELKSVGYKEFDEVIEIMINNIESGRNKVETSNELVNKICLYLTQDPRKKITLNDILNISGLSKTHVCALFKKEFQLSPMAFREIYVSAYIKDLINNKDAKPQTIYKEFGYDNYVTFYRQQMNVFGIPPNKKFHYPKINPFLLKNENEYSNTIVCIDSDDLDK